jgi:hypothetical protein
MLLNPASSYTIRMKLSAQFEQTPPLKKMAFHLDLQQLHQAGRVHGSPVISQCATS